jgi:hypothetical protein
MGQAGYIYLMYAYTGHYKIGMSIRPDERLRSFRTEMPVDVEPVYIFPTDDMRLAEYALHLLFDEKRYRGEWFVLDNEDVEWIKSIYKFNAERVEFEHYATLSEEDDPKRLVQLIEYAAQTNARFTDDEGNPLMKESELKMMFHLSLLKERYGEIDIRFDGPNIYSPHIAMNFLRFSTALMIAVNDEMLEEESLLGGNRNISIGFKRRYNL